MKVLAILRPVPGKNFDSMKPLIEAEARQIWMSYKADIVREMHLIAGSTGAVLQLEVPSTQAAKEALASLPLLTAGLITTEIIGLVPFGSLEALFTKQSPH
jgi:hypothetical protein